MAERPAVNTKAVTRDQLADLAGKNHRAIRFLETIAGDVGGVLPDASLANAQAAEAAQNAADAARIVADEALDEAVQAQGDAYTSGVIAAQAARDVIEAADVANTAAYLVGQVAELRDMLSALAQRVYDLEVKP